METFKIESYSKVIKKIYSSNKLLLLENDDYWSFHSLDWNDYGTENKRCFKWIFVEIHNLTKLGFRIPFKNKNAQAIIKASNGLLQSQFAPLQCLSQR